MVVEGREKSWREVTVRLYRVTEKNRKGEKPGGVDPVSSPGWSIRYASLNCAVLISVLIIQWI